MSADGRDLSPSLLQIDPPLALVCGADHVAAALQVLSRLPSEPGE
jgi:hypothetical protein